ncbi:MAG TPA: type I 3-dehydroquinate dehydratase [Candidatus Polarisedimenticolaceae bacterium]|nr:type I 3-dehydroquinate dehydratase [Candidatus Polarisedimenticolaceae bacterium]
MRGGVVHSVFEETPEEAERRIAEAPEGAAFVEIRADRLRPGDVAGLVRRARLPVIVAARTPDDGGTFDGSAEERRAILRAALAAGCALADVEWNGPLRDLALGPDGARTLLSHHGAACDLPALLPLLAAMSETKAARLKIVPRATRAVQIAAVRELLARAGATPPLAAFATGACAIASRALALSWGSWGTYGAASRSRRTGDGQPETRELLEDYRVGEIGEGTRRYALVGAPLDRSPSPALHAAGFRSIGLDAVYLPIPTEQLAEVEALVGPEGACPVEGLGVTIPLKEAAAARCVALDEFAACGAANTVRIEPAGWRGFNTDAPAALALARRHVELARAEAAVVGAGGTGRAIAAALVAAGARVTLFNRSSARGREAARAAGAAFRPLAALADASWDLLVQATPLGRDGEDLIAPRRLTGRMVLDAAYGPEPTPLVRAARKRGLAVADGYDLLLGQAGLQFERLTGEPPPEAAMAAALDPWRSGGPA